MDKKINKYAVVKVAGKQYVVKEGKEVLVDKLKDPKKIETSVLLSVNGSNVKVGKPEVKDIKVSFEVLSEAEKQDKIRVFKYKSKSRYRKRTGFRAKMTRLLVKSIS